MLCWPLTLVAEGCGVGGSDGEACGSPDNNEKQSPKPVYILKAEKENVSPVN